MRYCFGRQLDISQRVKLLQEISTTNETCTIHMKLTEECDIWLEKTDSISVMEVSDNKYCVMLTGNQDEYIPSYAAIDKDFTYADIMITETTDWNIIYHMIVAVMSALYMMHDVFLLRGYVENDVFITGVDDVTREQILLLGLDDMKLFDKIFVSVKLFPAFKTGSLQKCNNSTYIFEKFNNDIKLLDNYVMSELKKGNSDEKVIGLLNFINERGYFITADTQEQLQVYLQSVQSDFKEAR